MQTTGCYGLAQERCAGAVANWLRGVEQYRVATRAFRHALALRAKTDRRFASAAESLLPALDEQLRRVDELACEAASAAPETGASDVGGAVLTRRERQIANLLARGLTNQAIAEELVIAPGTVANHVADILRRLGMRTRTEVAVWAIRHEHELADRNGHVARRNGIARFDAPSLDGRASVAASRGVIRSGG